MRKIILIFMVLAVSLYADTNSSIEETIYWKNQYVMKNRTVLEKDITDGDTFKHTYKGWEHKIRLYAIDTPEISRPKTDLEKKYGIEASNFFASMLTNKKATITIVGLAAGCRETGIVVIGQGSGNKKLNINEAMVSNGYAIVAERYCKNEKDRKKLLELQAIASNNQRGFWADTNFYPEIKYKIEYYKPKPPAIKK